MLVAAHYEEAIAAATRRSVEGGIRTLQIYWLADSERGNADRLLALMDPPDGAVVVDMGAGLGQVAALMNEARPDLEFVLVNNNRWQLEHSAVGFERVYADMTATGLPSESADVVMANYCIGYADLAAALAEFRRLLPVGGVLFVWDMSGASQALRDALGYALHDRDHFAAAAQAAGFALDFCETPKASDAHMLLTQAERADAAAMLSQAVPTVWRFHAR